MNQQLAFTAIGFAYLAEKRASVPLLSRVPLYAQGAKAWIAQQLNNGGITTEKVRSQHVPLTGRNIGQLVDGGIELAGQAKAKAMETIEKDPTLALAAMGGLGGAAIGGITGATNGHSPSHRLGRIGRGILAGGGTGVAAGGGLGLVYEGVGKTKLEQMSAGVTGSIKHLVAPETRKEAADEFNFHGQSFDREKLRGLNPTQIAELRKSVSQARGTPLINTDDIARDPIGNLKGTLVTSAYAGLNELHPHKDMNGKSLLRMLRDKSFDGTLTPEKRQLIDSFLKSSPDEAQNAERLMGAARGTGIRDRLFSPKGHDLIDGLKNHVGFEDTAGRQTFLPGHATATERQSVLDKHKVDIATKQTQLDTLRKQQNPAPTQYSPNAGNKRRSTVTPPPVSPPPSIAPTPDMTRVQGEIDDLTGRMKNVGVSKRVMMNAPGPHSGPLQFVKNLLSPGKIDSPFSFNKGRDYLLSGVVEPQAKATAGTTAPLAKVHDVQDYTHANRHAVRTPAAAIPTGAMPTGPNRIGVQTLDLLDNMKEHQSQAKNLLNPRRRGNLGMILGGVGFDAITHAIGTQARMQTAKSDAAFSLRKNLTPKAGA